jgi:predicted dehydrogenase
VLTRTESGARETEHVWRRQGREITISNAAGRRAVESQGSDVERMLANFRDVVLGKALPGATLEDALDVMRTARRVVEALAAAGAPFDRPNAPRHTLSREMRPGLQ